MAAKKLSDAELMILGLVAEMPRHGYELEQVIEARSLREWSALGFSSIYFVLGKLEKSGLLAAKKGPGAKGKKIYSLTEAGQTRLVERTEEALRSPRTTYSSLLLGMVHWPVLEKEQALKALADRCDALQQEKQRLQGLRIAQQPLPDYLDTLFDYSLGQLEAELSWTELTLEYMRQKPCLEGNHER